MKKDLDPIEFEERKPVAKRILGFDMLTLLTLAAALILFIVGLLLPMKNIIRLILMVLSFLAAAYGVAPGVWKTLQETHMPDGNLLVILACVAAFILRQEVDGAAVMLIYCIGRLLLEYTENRTRASIDSAVYPRPARCTVALEDGERSIAVKDIKAGDLLVLHPGDCVPADCIVADGYTSVDESAITGESELRAVEEGDMIYAGSVNISSLVQAEAAAPASGSTLARAAQMMYDPYAEKTSFEKWTDRYSRIFVPVAVAACALFAVLLAVLSRCTVSEAVHRALVFLIVLSPVTLLSVIALTCYAGLGGEAHQGVVLKGAGVMERLARTSAVVFDQEGTITSGGYSVDVVKSERMDSDTLLKAAAHAAANASSPAAQAILNAYGGSIDYSIIGGFCEYPDGGISVTIEGIPVLLGRRAFLLEKGIPVPGEDNPDTLAIHIALASHYAGMIRLTDTVRGNASEAVRDLAVAGCEEIALLSGDSKEKTRFISQRAGIDRTFPQCTPMEKLAHVQEMCEESGRDSTVYVGGSSADPAALSAADVGMILCGFEQKKLLEDADAIGMNGSPAKVAKAITAARNADAVLKQSVYFTLGVKALLLLLTLLGVTDQLWFAVFADTAAGLVCMLNAIRAFTLEK